MSFLSAVFGRALASRNYRLYFFGQLISLAGTWMQQIAMVWLAWRLSNSAQVLGLVGFASQIPILLLGPIAGVVTDRFDRRRILIATQSIALLQALGLAALTWMHWATPVGLIVLAFVLGCINALDLPARQAFSVELVDDRADLPNAVALNSMLMNAARFVGPALAGLAVAAIGEAWCFVANAASYLAVIAALLAIDAKAPAPRAHAPAFAAFKDGLRYALGHAGIRARLAVVAAISFLVTPYAVLMPLFASEIFQGDSRTYGFLIGCAGAGSLFAGLYLAARRGTEGLSKRTMHAVIVTGAALSSFALNDSLPLAFAIVMVLGFAVILVIAGSNTLIQVSVEDAYRGRVMAIFSTAFLGIAPLGALAIGHLAHAFGIRPTLLGCGMATVLAGLLARRRSRAAR